MRKKITLLIVMFCMIFGSALTVHAEETSGSYNYYVAYPSKSTATYGYGMAIKSNKPMNFALSLEGLSNGSSLIDVSVLVSESSFTFGYKPFTFGATDSNHDWIVGSLENLDAGYQSVLSDIIMRYQYESLVTSKINVKSLVTSGKNYYVSRQVEVYGITTSNLPIIRVDCKGKGYSIGSYMSAVTAYFNGNLDSSVVIPDINENNTMLDKSIGYLRNVQRIVDVLQSSEGTPTDVRYKFTWDDTYSDYTTDYKVQVNAVCKIGVKSLFGLGKPKYSESENMYLQSCTYKDLKTIIQNTNLNSIFGGFIESTKDSAGFSSVTAWDYIYYFRIYVYDKSINKYRCGQWLQYLPDGSVFEGKIKGKYTVGDFDKDGNWIIDSTTDYGTGIPGIDISGVGETWEEAEKSEKEEPKFDFDFTFDSFLKQLNSIKDSLSGFPDFISSLLGYLPPPVILFIGLGITSVVILRFLGR